MKAPWFAGSFNDGVLIDIYVQPNSKFNRISGTHGQCLKIQLMSAPIEGKANEALRKFISKTLNTSKSHVRIIKGEKSRYKRIFVKNIQQTDVLDILPESAKN